MIKFKAILEDLIGSNKIIVLSNSDMECRV
jgi:hypothetical protein